MSEKIDNEYGKADALDHWCNMPRDMLLGWKNEATQIEEDNAELKREIAHRVDELELAWIIIANAGGGDWTTQTQDWQDAATRWRNKHHALLADTKEQDDA